MNGRIINRITSLFTAILLCVLLACPDAADAHVNNESDISLGPYHVNGYIPVTKKAYNVPESETSGRKLLRADAATLPSSYRSDEQPWAAGIKVKDQDTSGLCWAFSITTAAEYSYAKEIYEATGRTGVVSETSPGHLAQFYYNRVNDPLGNTAGDANELFEGESWPLVGGNQLYGLQHMATWSGLGLETDSPMSSILDHIVNGKWDNSYLPYPDSIAYNDYITIQNCEGVFFNSFANKTTLKNKIKELTYDYGAVSIGINQQAKFMNAYERKPNGQYYLGGRSFYDYEQNDVFIANHAVTIIGWDDNYPASNFTHKVDGMSNEEAYELTTPSNDGAWIIQNSWGSEFHDNGFFYASYECLDFQPINNGDAYVFDMQPADTYTYNFQYDGTSDCGDSSDDGNTAFYTRRNTKAANVFTNTTGYPINLEAIGFTTFNNGQTTYKIDVYSGLTNASNPTSGTLASTMNYSTTMLGFKTAVLNDPVYIEPGETFSIVFTFNGNTFFGVEKDRDDLYTDFVVQTDPGQSFFASAYSSRWTDLNNYGACFRIKGFANIDPAASPSPVPSASPTPTASATATASVAPTGEPTPTAGATATASVAPTGEPTPTASATATVSPSPSPTPIPLLPTDPPSVTASPTGSPTPTASATATSPPTGEPGITPTETPVAAPTAIPVATPNNQASMPTVTKEPALDLSVRHKVNNTLKVKGRLAKIRYKKLLRKSKKLKRKKTLKISGAKGRLTYKLVKARKKKYFKINKKTGALTIKKKLGKGLYKIKVKVTASGNANYKKASKTATIKVKIK